MRLKSVEDLRVLFFAPMLGGGGAEKHLLYLANTLDRNCFRVGIAVARPGGAYESKLAPDVSFFGLSHVRSSSTRSLIQSTPALRRLILRERPHIVCSFLDHANLCALAACRSILNPPRLVLGVQNNPSAAYATGPMLVYKPILWGIRTVYQYADRVVSLSHGVADDLLRLNPALHQKIDVIHNACLPRETKEVEAQADFGPTTEPVVLACGRLVPQKGFSYLLRAFQRVRKKIRCQLQILGEGPDRSSLETLARQLGIQEHVSFLGFQKNPEDYMARAQVFVLSSIYEGFGNVIVEAMASGAPVVSTDCPFGPSEIIQHGENGWLVPSGDSDALAKGICMVLENAPLGARLRRNGKVRAEDFRADRIAREYERVFEAVASKLGERRRERSERVTLH